MIATHPTMHACTSGREVPIPHANEEKNIVSFSDFDPETTQFYQNYLRNCEIAREHGHPLPPRPQHMIVDADSVASGREVAM